MRARALEVLRRLRVSAGPQLPLIGVGGIDSPQAAWDRIAAGASLVQLYTGWTDRKDLKTINVETWYGKIYYQLHRAFQLMLDVEASMAEHCQPHSAAELRERSRGVPVEKRDFDVAISAASALVIGSRRTRIRGPKLLYYYLPPPLEPDVFLGHAQLEKRRLGCV